MKKIDVKYYVEKGTEIINARVVGDYEIFLLTERKNILRNSPIIIPSAVNAQISRMSGEINEQPGAIILSGKSSEPVLFAQIERV